MEAGIGNIESETTNRPCDWRTHYATRIGAESGTKNY